jgi:hypothetical protein
VLAFLLLAEKNAPHGAFFIACTSKKLRAGATAGGAALASPCHHQVVASGRSCDPALLQLQATRVPGNTAINFL